MQIQKLWFKNFEFNLSKFVGFKAFVSLEQSNICFTINYFQQLHFIKKYTKHCT